MSRERDIQRLILDWLAAQKIWHIRLNTGAMSGAHKGKRWFVRFGKPGMADILIVGSCPVSIAGENRIRYWSQVAWVEVKAPKGVQSEDQKAFQKEVEAAGMTYILARSLEDVSDALQR